MRLIDASYEIIPQEEGLLGVYKQIEKAARTAYKSEDKIAEGSAQRMVESLCKLNHGAALEHGTIYLEVPYFLRRKDPSGMDWAFFSSDHLIPRVADGYYGNPYSKVSCNPYKQCDCITTNARVIFENGWEDDLQYMCKPTEFHEKRITVKFTTSMGIVREILRHRRFSFLNESTRYCNYGKDKFGSELTFIIPQWIYNLQAEEASYPDPCDRSSRAWLMNERGEDLIKNLICMDRTASSWWDAMTRAEEDYMYFITTDEGYKLRPEEAR
jgi:thymidylate synthase (FAD)